MSPRRILLQDKKFSRTFDSAQRHVSAKRRRDIRRKRAGKGFLPKLSTFEQSQNEVLMDSWSTPTPSHDVSHYLVMQADA